MKFKRARNRYSVLYRKNSAGSYEEGERHVKEIIPLFILLSYMIIKSYENKDVVLMEITWNRWLAIGLYLLFGILPNDIPQSQETLGLKMINTFRSIADDDEAVEKHRKDFINAFGMVRRSVAKRVYDKLFDLYEFIAAKSSAFKSPTSFTVDLFANEGNVFSRDMTTFIQKLRRLGRYMLGLSTKGISYRLRAALISHNHLVLSNFVKRVWWATWSRYMRKYYNVAHKLWKVSLNAVVKLKEKAKQSIRTIGDLIAYWVMYAPLAKYEDVSTTLHGRIREIVEKTLEEKQKTLGGDVVYSEGVIENIAEAISSELLSFEDRNIPNDLGKATSLLKEKIIKTVRTVSNHTISLRSFLE